MQKICMPFILGFQKIHSHKHKTARVSHENWLDGKEKLRKTGNEWKTLMITSKKTWRQERKN